MEILRYVKIFVLCKYIVFFEWYLVFFWRIIGFEVVEFNFGFVEGGVCLEDWYLVGLGGREDGCLIWDLNEEKLVKREKRIVNRGNSMGGEGRGRMVYLINC